MSEEYDPERSDRSIAKGGRPQPSDRPRRSREEVAAENLMDNLSIRTDHREPVSEEARAASSGTLTSHLPRSARMLHHYRQLPNHLGGAEISHRHAVADVWREAMWVL